MAGNFIVYLIGHIIAIIGVGFFLVAAGMDQQLILAAVLIPIGLGVVVALSHSQRDAASRENRPAKPAERHQSGCDVVLRFPVQRGSRNHHRRVVYDSKYGVAIGRNLNRHGRTV